MAYLGGLEGLAGQKRPIAGHRGFRLAKSALPRDVRANGGRGACVPCTVYRSPYHVPRVGVPYRGQAPYA